MTHPLPPKQQAVLEFIQGELDAGRKFPTVGSIAKFMGWANEGSAYDCLNRLAWRGALTREIADRRQNRLALRYTWRITA